MHLLTHTCVKFKLRCIVAIVCTDLACEYHLINKVTYTHGVLIAISLCLHLLILLYVRMSAELTTCNMLCTGCHVSGIIHFFHNIAQFC